MARPRGFESRRRTRDLVVRLVAGERIGAAAAGAGVDPGRVLRMFDSDEFWCLYRAVRDGQPGSLEEAA